MAGALREILARFGFDVDTSKLDSAKQKTDGLSGGLKALAATIAGSAIIGGIRSFVSELEEQAGQLRRTSQQLGISTEDLQRWQGAAKIAGVSNEGLATGFKFLQKNAAEAATKGGDAAAEFTKLGIKIKDSNGQIKPTSQLMREAGLAIGGIKDPSLRTATALSLLGRNGIELVPLFNKGEKGLQEFLDRIDELGGGLSQNAIATLGKYSRSTQEFDFSILSLKSRLAEELIPKLTEMVNRSTGVVLAFAKLTKGSNIFTAAITVLGTVAAIAAIKIYAPYLPIIALFAGLVLLVDELITLFQGGDSFIGDAIDQAFGAGTAAVVVSTLTKAFQDLKASGDLVPAVIGLIGAAFLAANPPLAVFLGAIKAITAAYEQFQKIREEWDGKSFVAKLKQDFTPGGDQYAQRDAFDKAKKAYEDHKSGMDKWDNATGLPRVPEAKYLTPGGMPTTSPEEDTKKRQAALTLVQGFANSVPRSTAPYKPESLAPPPLLARPPEPVIQKKEITVKTQNDSTVTFVGPSPGKGDVAKGLSDGAKAVQAAVLAGLEGQK